MMTDDNLISPAVFLADAPGSITAYAYDACAHATHLHTASTAASHVRQGFFDETGGPGSTSCATTTTTTCTYDASARFSWLSRDPIEEEGGGGIFTVLRLITP